MDQLPKVIGKWVKRWLYNNNFFIVKMVVRDLIYNKKISNEIVINCVYFLYFIWVILPIHIYIEFINKLIYCSLNITIREIFKFVVFKGASWRLFI
jgi:hypothetical protein